MISLIPVKRLITLLKSNAEKHTQVRFIVEHSHFGSTQYQFDRVHTTLDKQVTTIYLKERGTDKV
jgi:hypothetical protein